MKRTSAISVATLLLIFVLAPSVMADWINLSGAQSAPNIAEIYVEDDHVFLVLEVFVDDLDKFLDLLPDNFLKKGGIEPPHCHFTIIRSSGNLKGRI